MAAVVRAADIGVIHWNEAARPDAEVCRPPQDRGAKIAANDFPAGIPSRCDAEASKMRDNEEPWLADVLVDPIIGAVMRRDAVSEVDLNRLITEIRGRLLAEGAGTSRPRPDAMPQSDPLP